MPSSFAETPSERVCVKGKQMVLAGPARVEAPIRQLSRAVF